MTTPFLLGSYLTCEEYRAAPTALATNALVPGGNQAAQDSALAGLIGRASRQIDSWARQPLYATPGTQSEPVRVRDGDAILHAHQDRVKQVTAFSWGAHWTTMTALATPTYFVEENRTRVQLAGGGTQWSGSLNLNSPVSGTVYASWSYVAGWATTRLTSAVLAGATAVTVDNPAGIVVGTNLPALWLRLVDGATQNTYQVQSVAGSVVTLATPLAEAWPAGAGASEVPDDIKEAAVLVVSEYIKMRASGGWAMDKTPKVEANTAKDLSPEMALAKDMAERWQRKHP